MNYNLNIPRYAQHFAADEWPEGVLIEDRDSENWGDCCCGLACLRMILAYYQKPVPTQYELLVEGLKQKAYTSVGWIHQGLANLGEKYGVSASPIVIESGNELEQVLQTTGPVIVSITPKFPEDGRKGGHLVVVCGRHYHPTETTICFRDSSRWGRNHSIVSEERFFSSFTGRGIVFSNE